MDTLCLDALPAEILLRIASLGPAENLLSLQLVCHRLHDTLFDTIVFRELLEPEKLRSVGYGVDIDAAAFYLGNDTAAWAQLAVADCRAKEIFAASATDAEASAEMYKACLRTPDKLDRYVPALVALKHSSLSQPRLVEILLGPIWTQCSKHSRRKSAKGTLPPYEFMATSPGLAFSLCASTLAFPPSSTSYKTKRYRATKIISACADVIEDLVHPDLDNYRVIFNVALANITLSAWSSLLYSHVDEHCAESDPHMPKPTNIPWLDTTSSGFIPLPFESHETAKENPHRPVVSWDRWYQECVEHMSSPDYFTKVEWCGYYSYDNDAHYDPHNTLSVEFAEPIDSMVLVVPAEHRRSARNMKITNSTRIVATYPNSIHNFTLEGSISPEGIFDLGPVGEGWIWRGRMTPFGLFGFWGSSDWSRVAGACWLWQKSWCPPPATA